MRKKLLAITAAVTLFVAAMSTSVMADNGSSRDYAGSGAVVYSDIGAYVNHYPIASYSCGGKTVVVAEDLRSFGFDVDWNDSDRALYITPSYSGSISGSDSVYSGAGRQGRAFAYVLNSDIKVYINGREIPAYCIDGYMLISLEDLASLTDGIEFTWDSSTRSAKLWISWCPITVWYPIPVWYEDASAQNSVLLTGSYLAYAYGEPMAGLEVSNAGDGNLNIEYSRRHNYGLEYSVGTAYLQADGTYVADGVCSGTVKGTGEYVNYGVKFALTPMANGNIQFDMFKTDTGEREDVGWIFIKNEAANTQGSSSSGNQSTTSKPTPVPTSKPTPVPISRPTLMPTSKPTPVPTSKPTPVPTKAPQNITQSIPEGAVPGVVVGTGGRTLAINSKPAKGNQIGEIPEGATVAVYSDKTSGNWYWVSYNGVSGYSYKDYLSVKFESAPSVNTPSSGNSSSFDEKVNAFLSDSQWAIGTSWGANQRPKLSTYDCKSCYAYAADFTKYVFNINNPKEGKAFTNANDIKAGDVVNITNHWFVVIGRNGNTLTSIEGNYSSSVNKSTRFTISGSSLLENGKSVSIVNAYHFQ